MIVNIDCQYHWNGKCHHGAAPRGLFSAASCLLSSYPTDPRTAGVCRLRVEYVKPEYPFPPPPKAP